MLVKILARHSPSYKSLLSYILNEAKATEIITHNIRGADQEVWTKEFLENESFRKQQRSDQIYLYHEIISLSAKEHMSAITQDMLRDLSKEYISLRGKDGMFVGAVHQDREHVHIHLCTSGLKFRTGQAFRLGRKEMHELKVRFQEYHKKKYPELSESFCEHGKGKEYVTDREWQKRNRTNRALLKDDLKEKVKACFGQAKSQNEFLSLLRDSGFHHYERNGKAVGVTHENMKFRFSRLELSKEQLDSLPLNGSEEQKALEEISALREKSQEIDRDLDRD